MERISKPALPTLIRTYALLTKPGILFGNAMTAIAGFVLASRGSFAPLLFTYALLGLLFVMASGCVFNNCIDRDFDAKMRRTQSRALVQGTLSVKQALVFGSILLLLGTSTLYFFVNLLSMAFALFGFLIYVFFYSYSKHYSSYGTLIGSLAGATPPAIGYLAVTNQFDLGALLLFATIVFWQMPHFYAIAIYRYEDYKAASIPVLPIAKGMLRTKIEMVAYILAFIASSSAMTYFGYTGALFAVIMNLVGWLWLGRSLKGFNCEVDKVWGRKMFLFSLIVVMAFSFTIPISLG